MSGPAGAVVVLGFGLAVLAMRVVLGLDFTDEMQYYGEVLSLLQTGQLFTTDLFVQQIVYPLFFPVFKAVHGQFEQGYLVLTGRIQIAVLIAAVVATAHWRFLRRGGAAITAALAALMFSFAIPYHNIFAPSYNTVGQVMLIAFFLAWEEWTISRQNIVLWLPVVLGVLGLANPILGTVCGAIVAVRISLDPARASLAWRFAVSCVVVLLALVALLFAFVGSLEPFREASRFSQAFGVGSALFGSIKMLAAATVIVGVFGLVLVRFRRESNRAADANAVRLLVLALLLCAGASLILPYAMLFPVAAALAMAFVAERITVGGVLRGELRLTIAMGGIAALTLAIVSGNGVMQMAGGAMVLLPLMYARVDRSLSDDAKRRAWWRFGVGGAAAALYIVHAFAHPYRDAFSWALNGTSTVPAFRGIAISPAKQRAIDEVRSALRDVPAGGKTLVIGAQPWMYFLARAVPDTDMIFMHFTGDPKAFDIVGPRLARRRPDYIIVTSPAPKPVTHAIDKILATGEFERETFAISQECVAGLAREMTYVLNPTLILYRRKLSAAR